MRVANAAGLGAVIIAGAAIGWVGVGERAGPTAASSEIGSRSAATAARPDMPTNQWSTAPVQERQRSADEDGGPDTGLPPPPAGIDVAADAMARAQGGASLAAAPDGPGSDASPAPAVATSAPPRTTPQQAPAPGGNGWRPGPDAGWGPPAGDRSAGRGPSSR